jgi:hypothetical protein
MGRSYNEKRDYLRMRVGAQLSCAIQGESTTFLGYCKNLSHTGIQFETARAVPEGSILEVTIESKSSKFNPMKATIKVIRLDQISDKQYMVAGEILEFQ